MLELSSPYFFTPPSAKIYEVLTSDIKQEGSVTEVRFGA
jgi:hypothetical protein